MQISIAVVGASQPSDVASEQAIAVGAAVAAAGATLVTGGLGGIMEAACRGARGRGGLTVGILPGTSKEDANPYVDCAVPTGLGDFSELSRRGGGRCSHCARGSFRDVVRDCDGVDAW